MSEPTIFDLSSAGAKNNYFALEKDIDFDLEDLLGKENIRAESPGLPEISENEVVRHFTFISFES